MATTNALPTAAPRMPALFVSHGSPMFALEHGSTAPALRAWAASLPAQPRAIVVMSPHWMAATATVMTTAQPSTWHDFGGFPAPLYALQYPAPGNPALAQRVLHLLQEQGIAALADNERPLDHGAWVPLMHLFPDADIPVLQIALPADYTPRSVWAMGHALGALRDEGVLVIGSGSMTHNLREFFSGRPALDAAPAPYVDAFARWIEQQVLLPSGQAGVSDNPLWDYRAHAPQAAHAHPTDEHFVPLYFALGAGGWDGATATDVAYLSREVMYSYLAMDAFAIA